MTITELDNDVDFHCGSTSGTYTTTAKRRNQNIAYHGVARMIWEADGSYDDSNNTDSPTSKKLLGNASGSYTIPTTALMIKGVEVKDSSGVYQKLRPITLQDLTVSPDNYMTGSGLPIEYMVEGNEIRLFPAPGTGSVTMASGMAIRLARTVTEIPVSATTSTPGFATPFHRILSYAAAIDFTQDEKQREYLIGQRDRLEKGLTRFYAKKLVEVPSRIKPAGKKRWQQYT